MSSSVQTVDCSPASPAMASALSANTGAVSEPPGSLERSRATHTPAEMAEPRASASLAAADALPTTSTRASLGRPPSPSPLPAADL